MVPAEKVAAIAVQARTDMKLRHVPLYLARELARLPEGRKYVRTLLPRIIQRADELAEFVSLYWKDGRQPLSAAVKKGLAEAFTQFSAFELAKYNRDGKVKLRDVLFLCHAKPKDEEQAKTFKQLVDGTLPTPDTWETAISATKGEGKLEEWTRLLTERKLGGLALLRNLRNMREVGVNQNLIRAAISQMKVDRVLPYRFIAAARVVPDFEPELEAAMYRCLTGVEQMDGRTALLVDVSDSMDGTLSEKSDMTRLEAACAMAILLRQMGEVDVYTFSQDLKKVPPRRGFALRDAITTSQHHGGTYLGQALNTFSRDLNGATRTIVITDEQSHDATPAPPTKRGYIINVASYQHGVGYGPWVKVTGWSEAIVKYIQEMERTNAV